MFQGTFFLFTGTANQFLAHNYRTGRIRPGGDVVSRAKQRYLRGMQGSGNVHQPGIIGNKGVAFANQRHGCNKPGSAGKIYESRLFARKPHNLGRGGLICGAAEEEDMGIVAFGQKYRQFGIAGRRPAFGRAKGRTGVEAYQK